MFPSRSTASREQPLNSLQNRVRYREIRLADGSPLPDSIVTVRLPRLCSLLFTLSSIKTVCYARCLPGRVVCHRTSFPFVRAGAEYPRGAAFSRIEVQTSDCCKPQHCQRLESAERPRKCSPKDECHRCSREKVSCIRRIRLKLFKSVSFSAATVRTVDSDKGAFVGTAEPETSMTTLAESSEGPNDCVADVAPSEQYLELGSSQKDEFPRQHGRLLRDLLNRYSCIHLHLCRKSIGINRASAEKVRCRQRNAGGSLPA